MSDDEDSGLESRALRSAPWSLLAYAVVRGTSLIGTIVLARMLTPGELGVYFTAVIVLAAVNLLGDTGLGVTLVVRDHVDDTLIGCIFTCMVGGSFVLAIVIALMAEPLANLLNTPQLADILPWLAISAVFNTATYFFMSVLQRQMRFDRRFTGQLAQSVVYVGVAVPAAAAGAGVWSPVAGLIAGSAASAIVLWRVTPIRLRPRFHLATMRSVYYEARHFLSQGLTGFVVYNLQFFAVSGILGSRAMGQYTMAFRFSEIPYQGLSTPIAQATLPAFARMKDEGARRRQAVLASVRYLAVIGLPMTIGLAALAPVVVAGLLGPSWTDMTPTLVLLALWGAFAMVNGVLAWFANAVGEAGWLARMNLRYAIAAPIVFAAAIVFDAPEAVAAVVLADIVVEHVLLVRRVHKVLEIPTPDVYRALRAPLIGSLTMAVVGIAMQVVLAPRDMAAALELVACVVPSLAAYAAVTLRFDPLLISGARSVTARAFSRA